jgi:hypothetical protein
MSLYIRLECDALTDEKVLAASGDSFALWVKGLLYSKQHLTDGFVPSVALPIIGVGVKRTDKAAAELVSVGLWTKVDGGYAIGVEKWARYQTSKDQVDKQREQWRDRSKKTRASRRDTTNNETDSHVSVTRDTSVTHASVTRDVTQESQAESRTRHVRVTQPDSDSDSDSDSEKKDSAPVGAAPSENGRKTWLTPIADVWTKTIGGEFPGGQAAKVCKPLLTNGRFTADLLASLEAYLTQHRGTESRFLDLPKWAATWPQWLPKPKTAEERPFVC